jgi:hypothetical protein
LFEHQAGTSGAKAQVTDRTTSAASVATEAAENEGVKSADDDVDEGHALP